MKPFALVLLFWTCLCFSLAHGQIDSVGRLGIHQSESELHRWDVLKTHVEVPELRKGADLARQGDIRGAICAFQIAAPKRKSYAYFNLGVLYFETGSLSRAERYFHLSYNARRDPVCLEYLLNARRLLKERKQRQ